MSEDASRFEWAQPRTGERERVDPAGREPARTVRAGDSHTAADGRESPRGSRVRPTGVDATDRPATADASRVRFRVRIDGRIETEPAVRDGTVYLGCANGCTHAFDADDGTERWSTRTDGRVTAPAVAEVSAASGGSSDESDGGVVYAGTDRGRVVALDAATGDRRWEDSLRGGVQASPAVVDDTVFVAADDGRISARHAADGSPRRTFRNAARALCSLSVDDGRLLLASLDGGAYARDRTDGREHWRFEPAVAIRGAPAVADGTAYLGTVDGGRVYAVSAVTGRERWRVDVGASVWAAPAVAGDADATGGSADSPTVVVGASDGVVRALDAADGSTAWRTPVEGRIWASPTVVEASAASDGAASEPRDETILVATDAGLVYALDAADGAVLWWYRAADAVVAPVAVAGGTAYVADCGGTVAALSVSE